MPNQVTDQQAFLWDTYLRYREITVPVDVKAPGNMWCCWKRIRPCNHIETWKFLYKEYFELTVVFKVLKCSFSRFKELMVEGIPDPYPRRKKKFRHTRYRMPGHKNNTRFRRNYTHKNHILSDKEQNDREWRKQRHDPRDQGTCNWSSMARKSTKHDSSRAERALVRAMISKGDWESMYHPHKWECCDPWKYD